MQQEEQQLTIEQIVFVAQQVELEILKVFSTLPPAMITVTQLGMLKAIASVWAQASQTEAQPIFEKFLQTIPEILKVGNSSCLH